MRRLRLLFAAPLSVASMVVVAPAHADMVASSQSLLPNTGAADRRQLLQGDAMLRATARCVVKRATGQSAYLLTTVPGSGDENGMVASLRSSLEWCIPGADKGMRAPFSVLRGAIAEELYRAEFGTGIKLAPAAGPITWEYPFSKTDAGEAGRMMLEQTGRCVAKRRPDAVAALLASKPLSTEESKGVSQLSATLGECLAVGSTARLSRQSLRGALAEGLYEYARATRDGFPTTGSVAVAEKKK